MTLNFSLEWFQEHFNTPDTVLEFKKAKDLYLNGTQCRVDDDKEVGPTGGLKDKEPPRLTLSSFKGEWCPTNPKHTQYKRCDAEKEGGDQWMAIDRYGMTGHEWGCTFVSVREQGVTAIIVAKCGGEGCAWRDQITLRLISGGADVMKDVLHHNTQKIGKMKCEG
jgi:hypothetical protein